MNRKTSDLSLRLMDDDSLDDLSYRLVKAYLGVGRSVQMLVEKLREIVFISNRTTAQVEGFTAAIKALKKASKNSAPSDFSHSTNHGKGLKGESMEPDEERKDFPDVGEIDPDEVDSKILARIIAEIQHDSTPPARIFNRTHNRHNRGV